MGIYTIGPSEVGLVKRFGHYIATAEPGIHYHLPSPVESVVTVNLFRVRKEEIGFRTISPPPAPRYREVVEEAVEKVLLAYAFRMYGGNGSRGGSSHSRSHSGSRMKRGRKWQLCSGLFVLLKQKLKLGREVIRQLLAEVLEFFRRLVWGDVRSYA